MLDNALTLRLGMEHPIIQAPMAGATTVELVAAVSEAGGLGSLGAAYLASARIDEVAGEIDWIVRAAIFAIQERNER